MAIALKNNAVSKLDGSIGSGTTSITVNNGAKFPNPSSGNWFPITVEDEAGNMEIMRCTGRSGNVLTVQRGKDDTTAKSFSSGASVSLRMTAGAFTEVFDSKSDVANPTFTGGVIIESDTPRVTFVDTINAGAGKRYRLLLSGDAFQLLRDKNNDGDFSDDGEGTLFVINGASMTLNSDLDFKPKSIRWDVGFDRSGTNLNNLVTSGFYTGTEMNNAPDSNTDARLWVLVQRGGSDSYVSQTAWKQQSGEYRCYGRICFNGVWSSWKTVSNETLSTLADGTTAASGKLRVPAYNSSGVLAANGVQFSNDIGVPLVNAASASAARSVLELGTSAAVNFARIHAGDNTTVFDFATDTTPCTFMNTSALFSSRSNAAGLQLQRLDSNGNIAAFFRGTSSVGSISVTTTATAYNTSSDYRLKYDIEPLVTFSLSEDAAEYLLPNLRTAMALRPVSHRWLGVDEPNSALTYGYIAHEAQQVFPACVTGAKDAVIEIGTATMPERQILIHAAVMDEEGNEIEPAIIETLPAETHAGVTRQDALEIGAEWEKTGERPDHQKMDASKLIPVLNAGLQELTLLLLEQRATIAALEARIMQLES